MTLPTRNTFTGQYSYVSDDATDLGSSGFGLMFYNARWYAPYITQFSQPDTIIPDPSNSSDWNRYAYARNNPIRYNDPSGHCVIDEENGKCWTPRRWDNDNYIIAYSGLKELGLLGKDKEAMDYVTASECAGDVCDPANTQLFRAMMHRYNAFCSGGAWSVKCVQSFWGYIEGIRNAYEDNFTRTTSTENMAAAILGGNGASFGGFTNDGKGCFGADANQLCGWGNLTTVQANAFRDKFFSGWQDGCAQSSESQDCNLESDYNSIWIHYQGDEGYYTHFIVMALWVDQTYCSAGWCN